mmetsp:Transcript_62721/g.99445  ORF Transcript_62721/g.99445 Transcript_62721/m.99445 type:complete len:224 (-) Transcript_62721:101-772(-)
MPGNYRPPLAETYQRAREESKRLGCSQEAQKQRITKAYLGDQAHHLGLVQKDRRERRRRWEQKLSGNPMGVDWKTEDDAVEERLSYARESDSQLQAMEAQRRQELFDECLDKVDGRALAEEELRQLRLERLRLLERQKQLKTALALKRSHFSGSLARNCKALMQVADERGYGRVQPGNNPPKMTRGVKSKSLPTLISASPTFTDLVESLGEAKPEKRRMSETS